MYVERACTCKIDGERAGRLLVVKCKAGEAPRRKAQHESRAREEEEKEEVSFSEAFNIAQSAFMQ